MLGYKNENDKSIFWPDLAHILDLEETETRYQKSLITKQLGNL